jgi:uncharacterized membrane protein
MTREFDLTFRPPPPLSLRSAKVIVGVTAFIMLFAGLRFALIGAWMVIPFLLIDIALLIWAFRATRKAARASERLRLVDEHVVVERTDPRGETRTWTLPRAWTRVELEPYAPQDRLWLKHKRRKLLVGKHLNRRERRDVYAVMAGTLNG